MKYNKDKIYIENSYFGIPVYYDMNRELYFSEPESKEFINKFYEKKYWDNFGSKRIHSNFFYRLASAIIRIPDLLNYRNFQILKRLGYLKKDSRILEVGTGEGKNLLFLKKLGYNIQGVEMDPDNVEQINSLFNEEVVSQGNYENIQLQGKYDIIYLRHVFEHFLDLETVIQNLKNNLNNGGIIFIDVPFCESKSTLNWSINDHPHIYHFTRKSLKHCLEENGFRALNIQYIPRRDINITQIHLINKIYLALLMLMRIPKYNSETDIKENTIYDLIGIFEMSNKDDKINNL